MPIFLYTGYLMTFFILCRYAKEESILVYLKTVHDVELKYTRLHCLVAKRNELNTRCVNLLMELCRIVEGQRGRQSKKMQRLSEKWRSITEVSKFQ